MSIHSLGDRHPSISSSAWVAPGASIIGDVRLGDEVSIWFGAVLRGDNEPIRIGNGSNVQENSVLHVDHGCPIDIGENVTIGHQAMLHGCTIGDGSLIGIQAVVLNRARIGRNCLVGAGALVTEGKVFEDGWLILGSPAKALRPLTEQEIAGLAASADTYRKHLRHYATELKAWTP
ncbi:MAG: gamma carbonic anhydrase family protein [Lautropia sp.]|nr:gamma carbonic anhydrase family protein [Lautropia sp.]